MSLTVTRDPKGITSAYADTQPFHATNSLSGTRNSDNSTHRQLSTGPGEEVERYMRACAKEAPVDKVGVR